MLKETILTGEAGNVSLALVALLPCFGPQKQQMESENRESKVKQGMHNENLQ